MVRDLGNKLGQYCLFDVPVFSTAAPPNKLSLSSIAPTDLHIMY
jgi:hypothetical protein